MSDPASDAPPPSDAPQPPLLHLEAKDFLMVALGAIPGAILRWQLQNNLISNLIGCLALGAITARQPPPPALMLLGGIGFCGSLTTFSSWMLEMARLLKASGPWLTLGTAIGHLAAAIALVAVGGVIGRVLKPSRRTD
jgi:CrcB protein